MICESLRTFRGSNEAIGGGVHLDLRRTSCLRRSSSSSISIALKQVRLLFCAMMTHRVAKEKEPV